MRKPNYVRIDGQTMAGLSKNKNDGRYYATHSHPRVWFGSDQSTALARFRDWQGKQGKKDGRDVVAIVVPSDGGIDDSPALAGGIIQAKSYWHTLRQQLLENLPEVCRRTGLIVRVDGGNQSLTLAAIGTAYQRKTPALAKRYHAHVKSWWSEFCRIVDKPRVADLNSEDFVKYREAIYKNGKAKSYRYVNNRFNTIISVFRYSQTEGKDVENLARAVALTKMLRRLQGNGFNPEPITVESFQKLIAVADAKEKAILLFALNTAAYPIDICRATMASIDLKRGTYAEYRQKTGIPRVACLWKSTVKAITEYRKTIRNVDAIFISRNGTSYQPDGLIELWRRLLKRANVTAKFASIRDGAQTAAIQGGADAMQVKMVLGHRAGIDDHYLLRKPQMVADACKAVGLAYGQLG